MTFKKPSVKGAMGMIGLAQRAGKAVSGMELCEKAAREGKAELLLLDRDASTHTRERITRAAKAANIPLYVTDAGLGQCIGKPGRMACAITDKGFAREIRARISPESTDSVGNAGV